MKNHSCPQLKLMQTFQHNSFKANVTPLLFGFTTSKQRFYLPTSCKVQKLQIQLITFPKSI